MSATAPRMRWWTTSWSRRGTRPGVRLDNPDLRLRIRIVHEEVKLELDSSGESLHKRNWRETQTEVPMREVLACRHPESSGLEWTVQLHRPHVRVGDELPARGVVVIFIDKIEDVTAFVEGQLRQLKGGTGMEFLSLSYLNGLALRHYSERYQRGQQGIELEIKPFYNGNKYLLFVKKVYSDIRFVGAPSSAVGKFGADTDNWSYPRHTGDFSLFRIYADANGNPAPYSETNVPMRPHRWFESLPLRKEALSLELS